MRSRVRSWAAVVTVLAIAGPAPAVTRFFPDVPTDDPDENTVDYNLGSFSQVVVGFMPDPTMPDSLPFPNTAPAETILNVVAGGVISGTTFVYNNSTLNLNGGGVHDIYASYDPQTGTTLRGSNAVVKITSGTAGDVLGYGADLIDISGGTASAVGVGNGGSISMTGGQVSSVSSMGGSTAAVAGGHVLSDVTAGTNNLAVADHTGSATIDAAVIDGSLAALGDGQITLTSGSVDGTAQASENGTVNLNGGSVQGDVSARNAGIVNFGAATVSGAASVSDTGALAGSGGGSIGNGLTANGSAAVGLGNESISGTVTGYSTTRLTFGGCHLTVASGTAAVVANGSSNFLLRGATTVSGDVYALDTSVVAIESGTTVGGNVYASGGRVSLSGGVITGHVTVLGGTFDLIGGVVLGGTGSPLLPAQRLTADADPADSLGITVEDGGLLNIYGSNFATTLIDPNYNGHYSEYALTGTLSDGTPVVGATFLVQNGSGSSFALLPPVPEPATASLLVLGLAFAARGRGMPRR